MVGLDSGIYIMKQAGEVVRKHTASTLVVTCLGIVAFLQQRLGDHTDDQHISVTSDYIELNRSVAAIAKDIETRISINQLIAIQAILKERSEDLCDLTTIEFANILAQVKQVEKMKSRINGVSR